MSFLDDYYDYSLNNLSVRTKFDFLRDKKRDEWIEYQQKKMVPEHNYNCIAVS